jgi:isoleucyl-tRNA synthetase
MAAFKEVKRFDHTELEKEILLWWKENRIFEKSVEEREGKPTFSFYEGPPTANGRPGIHHVMARSIKDIFCRYKTMNGFHVERKGGWDTHGLPVEIEVEKELGLEGRHQVEEFGIARYNEKCRASVLRYKELWDKLTERMGYWVDLEHPYVTFKTTYIESVWWLLKQIYQKDLLYRGYKIQWYSPGSGTVLSSHEVSMGYKEVQDPSIYVRFRIPSQENTSFLAWTTTPWTLISNAALAVGADIDYVKVRHEGVNENEEYLILAEARLDVLDQANIDILDRFKGRSLIGTRYAPAFEYFVGNEAAAEAWRVVEGDFVSTEDGTGVVHIAPAFGADDYDVGLREKLPLLNPVTTEGRFSDEIDLVAGMWFKDADKPITQDLKQRGLVYKHETFLHNYPHDWRKGTPLISYPVDSWFIRTTKLKDRMIELNETINWQPESMGSGRFGEWLKNNVDWALSRRRFWGTPLPIWQSDAPGSDYTEVIGSVSELREKTGGQLPSDDADIDLHRPFVDSLTWTAPDGGTMRRVPDLIDVWFDSGAMPFAQWHYPFENEDKFKQTFPADFIAEGVDQTRGWFYTLHAIATLVMDSVAYKNVVVNGLILAEDGDKMSKSKGNAVDPFETIESFGADVVRWYMMSNTSPWENTKFSERGMVDTLRKFFNTLENVYLFFATYANIDGFTYQHQRIPVADRPELDRWIISRLNSTIRSVDAAFNEYNPTKSARQVENFVEELSNWYVRRSRRRFWKEAGDDTDKEAAYQTVYESLIIIAKLMSPIAPFFGEWLYRALNSTTCLEDTESVHLTDFPIVDVEGVDSDLERRMGLARTITSVVLSLRNQSGINVRQPLPRIMVVTGAGVIEDDVEQVREIVMDEVNVKDINYISTSSGIVTQTAKPNFKRLGRRLGKLMKAVNEAVRELGEQEIKEYVRQGTTELQVNGNTVKLGPEDLEISSEGIEGWLVDQEDSVTVALDVTVTDELRSEGFAREIVNRVQNMRKAANFEVTDRISIQYQATGGLVSALKEFGPWIRNETLALELEEADQPAGEFVESFDVGDERIEVAVRRSTSSDSQ